jgi:hypothetical protein
MISRPGRGTTNQLPGRSAVRHDFSSIAVPWGARPRQPPQNRRPQVAGRKATKRRIHRGLQVAQDDQKATLKKINDKGIDDKKVDDKKDEKKVEKKLP